MKLTQLHATFDSSVGRAEDCRSKTADILRSLVQIRLEGLIFRVFLLGEAKLICCFTGQATQKDGSVGRQKNKNKSYILITKARKLFVKLDKYWQKYEHDKQKTQKL